MALVEFSIGFIFYEIFQIKYTIRWRWVRYLFRYFQIFWIFLNISSGGVHLGWRWSSSGSGDRSIHRHHFHTTHTSHAHHAPSTMHSTPCTLPSTHLHTPPPSKPSTQPPLPQLLFLPCNAMACIATLNPAPKPFQFRPKPYSCLECRHKCESKRMRE